MSAVYELQLPSGHVALIDWSDRELLKGRNWYVRRSSNTLYVRGCRPSRAEHSKTHVFLHRLILGVPDGIWIDHRNGNGLDNRRANLRLATKSQNGANRGPEVTNSSGFKGVSWNRDRGKWAASIRINGRTHFLGRFDDPWEAAQAYNAAAVEAWGEFAQLNVRGGEGS